MLLKSLIYAAYTILSAYVESIRIKLKFGKISNISHFISTLIAFAGFVLIVWIFEVKSIFDLVFYSIICVLIRGVLYDPILNLLRKKEINYESKKSDNQTDKTETLFNWGFWKQRRIYLYSFIFMIFLYYTIHFILDKLS